MRIYLNAIERTFPLGHTHTSSPPSARPHYPFGKCEGEDESMPGLQGLSLK